MVLKWFKMRQANKQTHAIIVLAHDALEWTVLSQQFWEVVGTQRDCLANKCNKSEWHGVVVMRRQLVVPMKFLVKLLTHSAVRTVSTDQDVALVCVIVSSVDFDTVLVLLHRNDPLAQVNLFLWDSTPDYLVQKWATYDEHV